jgi:hypothetical protein
MIGRSFLDEAGSAAAKLSIPVGVSIATVLKALDPQWFIAIPTAAYAVGQLAYLIWKWRREANAKPK